MTPPSVASGWNLSPSTSATRRPLCPFPSIYSISRSPESSRSPGLEATCPEVRRPDDRLGETTPWSSCSTTRILADSAFSFFDPARRERTRRPASLPIRYGTMVSVGCRSVDVLSCRRWVARAGAAAIARSGCRLVLQPALLSWTDDEFHGGRFKSGDAHTFARLTSSTVKTVWCWLMWEPLEPPDRDDVSRPHVDSSADVLTGVSWGPG